MSVQRLEAGKVVCFLPWHSSATEHKLKNNNGVGSTSVVCVYHTEGLRINETRGSLAQVHAKTVTVSTLQLYCLVTDTFNCIHPAWG